MNNQHAVSRPLLAILAVAVLASGYLAQGSLFGADDPRENGFGDFSPIAFSSDETEVEDGWVMPENPRNPFLPFFTPDAPIDESGEDLELDLGDTE